MGNIAIGWSDWGDEASLETIGNEPGSGAVAAYLQTMQPQDVWQSTSLTSLYFELDRGSAQPWNAVALLFTNATAAATWRIRAAADQVSLTDGSEDYDSGSVTLLAAGSDATWDRSHGLLWMPAGVTSRWLRIDISDGANPAGYVRAGRLVVGNLWQPTRNAQYPIGWSHQDPSDLERTDGGALIPTARDVFLAADLRFDFLSEADAIEHLYEFRRLRGKRADLLAIADPDDDTYLQQHILYGLITRDDQLLHAGFRRYQHRLQLEELL